MEAVVVTHNSERDLSALVKTQSLLDAFERVIVVDNASTDGTREIARTAPVTLVELDDNLGFGAAANRGAGLCTTDLFALLNPDIRFSRTDIPAGMARCFADPRIGMAGPTLLLPDGSAQDSARQIPTPLELLMRRWTGEQQGRIASDTPREVPWLAGACLFIRKAAFDEVGGFDERFFLYFEDVDLCVRMREADWRVWLNPKVRVDHDHQAASREGLSTSATRLHIRSAARFFSHHPRYVTSFARRREFRAIASAA